MLSFFEFNKRNNFMTIEQNSDGRKGGELPFKETENHGDLDF